MSTGEISSILNADYSITGGRGNYANEPASMYIRYIDNYQAADTENFNTVALINENTSLDLSNVPGNPNALTATAKDVYGTGTGQDLQNFTAQYGNTFIESLDMGEALIINLQFRFNSMQGKMNFDQGHPDHAISAMTSSAVIQAAVAHSTGKFEISAYQLGGTPHPSLDNILPNYSATGHYNFVTCTFSNLNNCLNALYSLNHDYIGTVFSQVSKKGSLQGNLVPVQQPDAMNLKPYSVMFGLNAPKMPNLTPRFTLAQLYMNTVWYSSTTPNYLLVNHLLNAPIHKYYAATTLTQLNSLEAILKANYNLFMNPTPNHSPIVCYLPGQEQNCSAVLTYIQDNLKKVSPSAINTFLTGYTYTDPSSKASMFLAPIGQNKYVTAGTKTPNSFTQGAIYTITVAANKRHANVSYVNTNTGKTCSGVFSDSMDMGTLDGQLCGQSYFFQQVSYNPAS